MATLTKNQLVQQFNAYDSDTLERLHLLAKTTLVPQRDQLVQVDFARMVEYAHTLADQHFPEWTDRTKSDFGEFLVELAALFSDKDFFYINAMFREAFLMRADRYSNIVHASLSKGYKTPSRKSATASMTLTAGGGATELVPRGAIEFGLRGLESFTFTNEEFTLPESVGDVEVAVTMVHGTIKRFDTNYAGGTLLLTDVGIADGSIRLEIDGEAWSEVPSLYEGTEASRNFLVLYNDNAQAEIHFPKEAQFGLRPRFGAPVVATYRIGGGAVGNLVSFTLDTVLKADMQRALVEIIQDAPTAGGEDSLSKAIVRQRALSWQRTKGAAINTYDLGLLAREVSGVHNAYASSIGNLFYLYIVPSAGGTPSQELRDAVEAHVSEHLIMHHAVYVETPIYNRFVLKADLYVLKDRSNSGTRAIAEGIIRSYTDPAEQAAFGNGIVRTQLASLLYSQISGLQNVDFQELYLGATQSPPPATGDILVPPAELMDWANSVIVVNVIGGTA